MKSIYRWHGIVIAFFVATATALAQTPRIDPAGIPGALLICGGGPVSEAAFDRFIDLAGGAKAKIAVIVVDDEKASIVVRKGLANSAKKKDAAEPELLGWKDAKVALPKLTGVWLIAAHDYNISRENPKKEHPGPADFLELLRRSGVVATSGTHSEILREAMLLDPFGLVDMRLPSKGEDKKRSLQGLVAFDVKPGAGLLIKGRTLRAVGAGSTVISLWQSKTLETRIITLQGKAQEDLTALRRAAFDRMQNFPPKKVEPPVVENGTLVIVGGGGSPDGLYKKFVAYAGGEGKANIVIFPTANPEPLSKPPLVFEQPPKDAKPQPKPKRDGLAALFEKAGAKKVTILKGRTLADVESKESLDALREATGLWFDGGRQWRFVDCYENSKALPLMFDVLKRGGVIGGTSAGATIQGEYLARGGVFTNFDIRYEGYERGLGFLKGVAIDQHFTQRNRQPEMTQLMKVYPQYLGIGLDEATAIVVMGSVAEVIGKGKVHFYDARRKIEKGDPDYEALTAGGRYDLKERKVLAGD